MGLLLYEKPNMGLNDFYDNFPFLFDLDPLDRLDLLFFFRIFLLILIGITDADDLLSLLSYESEILFFLLFHLTYFCSLLKSFFVADFFFFGLR